MTDPQANSELASLGLGQCECCREATQYSVLLGVQENCPIDDYRQETRYYLPNQRARALIGTPFGDLQQVAFCHSCMRAIENEMRATIRRLKREYFRAPVDEWQDDD
jgi:hypothetical protein